ncbi:hypothetical protein [Hazenella coriacea]|uniref:hypothetical protein n=1 Tax=Hazenella coriacea TaxID=1179467 RepID=UPI001A9F1399|nr:hypothetical protein [Hazenella coriacea]
MPKEVRKELNKLYREGQITRKQLMDQMRNGLFDQDRLELKERFKRLLDKIPYK